MSPRTTRVLYAIHKWTGLITGVNVLIFSVTGAWIVYGWDVERFLRGKTGPDPFEQAIASFPHATAEQHASLDLSLAKISEAEGKPATLGRLYVYEDEKEPELLMASFAGEGGAPGTAQWYYLDASTGNVLKQPTVADADHGDAFSHWMYDLHAHLLLGATGYIITGSLAIAMFATNLTGLIIYWPFVKGAAFGAIRWRKKANMTAADMHKLVGITALMFNLMISWTGFVLALGAPISRELVQREVQSTLGVDTQAEPPAPELWAPTDKVLASATAALPAGMEISDIFGPGGYYSKAHFYVQARPSTPPNNVRPWAALVDPVTAEVLDVQALPLLSQVMRITYPMHFGNFGGWPVRVAFTLFALTSGFLSVSAYVMYIAKWRRKRQMQKANASEAVAESKVSVPQQRAAMEEV